MASKMWEETEGRQLPQIEFCKEVIEEEEREVEAGGECGVDGVTRTLPRRK